MRKWYKSLFPITSIAYLLTLTACSSSYQMAKSYKYESGKKQMIRLDNVWMKIQLYPNDRNEQSFNVICTFDDVAKGKRLKLSGLKIVFTDAITGDTAILSKPVELNSIVHKDATRHTEYMTDGDLQTSKVFDLNEQMFYIFSYLFKGNDQKQPVTKIRIHIEAKLDDNGKIETINRTYPFEKRRYLDIAGN